MIAHPPYIIRTARAADHEVLTGFIVDMARESESIDLDRNTVSQGVQHVFDTPSAGTYWVIEDETDTLVGSALVTSEWSDWHNTYYWWIQSVYIVPEHRGKGLFVQFLNNLEIFARKENVKELRLYVDKENKRAEKTYFRSGFVTSHYTLMTKPVG